LSDPVFQYGSTPTDIPCTSYPNAVPLLPLSKTNKQTVVDGLALSNCVDRQQLLLVCWFWSFGWFVGCFAVESSMIRPNPKLWPIVGSKSTNMTRRTTKSKNWRLLRGIVPVLLSDVVFFQNQSRHLRDGSFWKKVHSCLVWGLNDHYKEQDTHMICAWFFCFVRTKKTLHTILTMATRFLESFRDLLFDEHMHVLQDQYINGNSTPNATQWYAAC
jgi:hypothetical protein